MGDFEKPKKIIWPSFMKGFGDWIYFLKSGFEQLGIPVQMSDEIRETIRAKYYTRNIFGVFYFDAIYGNGVQRVWYDSGDFVKDYYENVVSDDEPYFKINLIKSHHIHPRMYPMGQRFTIMQFANLLPAMRELVAKKEYKNDILAIFRATERENRLQAVKIIRNQPWKSMAWVTNHPARKPIPAEFGSRDWLDFKDYLRAVCQSRLCLSMPGIGPFACRTVETMAMGVCVITAESDLVMPGEPEGCWIEFKRDFSDFVEKVDYYLNHPAERDAIAQKGLEYYKESLSPVTQAKYLLRILTELRK